MSRPRPSGRTDECGAGLITSSISAVSVLMVVLLASHVLLGLQRRSAVAAVAFDVARRVAVGQGDVTRVEAEDRARRLLSDPGAVLTWEAGPDRLSLRVVTRAASLLPSVGPLRALTRVDRTVTVRIETLR